MLPRGESSFRVAVGDFGAVGSGLRGLGQG